MINSVEISQVRKPFAGIKSRVNDYFALTKPRLSSLVLFTAAAGLLLATKGQFDPMLLLHLLLGTGFAAGGANALNMYFEIDIDSRMARTANRPLPTGRLQPGEALFFGSLLGILGVLYLAVMVNPLTSLLGAMTILSYLFLYTPLKRKTSLSTVVGALPGAIPPLMGWAAGRNSLNVEAWTLFSILFLWQLPHFLAIAWRYREDYSRAKCPLLPVQDPAGYSTGRQVVLQSLGLLLVSLTPTIFGLAGGVYFLLAIVLGSLFLGVGVHFALARSDSGARRLFLASLVYLPSLLACLAVDRIVF